MPYWGQKTIVSAFTSQNKPAKDFLQGHKPFKYLQERLTERLTKITKLLDSFNMCIARGYSSTPTPRWVLQTAQSPIYYGQ